jgi:hypothetical protein
MQRQGQSLDTARDQLYWFCAPLNIATLIALILIVTLSIASKRSGRAAYCKLIGDVSAFFGMLAAAALLGGCRINSTEPTFVDPPKCPCKN